MVRPCIPLAINAAISSRFASGASSQFDVIACHDAARGTTHHHVGICVCHCLEKVRNYLLMLRNPLRREEEDGYEI